MTEFEWISEIAKDAQKAANAFGYLPSVLIAQTCRETGYGSTDLSHHGIYNTVGMKAELLNDTWHSDFWHGEIYSKKTPEWYGDREIKVFAAFRVYNSYFDGLSDFCQFLRDARYEPGGKYKYRDLLGIRDPWTLIEGVRSRGYCTDPEYSHAIMDIIEKHNLTQYDVGGGSMFDIIDITGENEAPKARGGNPIEWIVLHYLGVPNADNPYLYGSGYGGHYNVTRIGKIYKAVDPRESVVWHCGGGLQGSGGHAFYQICTNFNSIGIECGVCADTDDKNLSDDSGLWYFTNETQEAAAWLVAELMHEYNIDIDHVIRHYDVTGKICPNPYVLNNERNTSWTWERFKERVIEYFNGGGSDYMRSFKTVHIGDKGADVGTMQKMLRAEGYKDQNGQLIVADRDFGIKTDFALKKYQKDHGLEVDGWCGKLTWGAMFGDNG